MYVKVGADEKFPSLCLLQHINTNDRVPADNHFLVKLAQIQPLPRRDIVEINLELWLGEK